MKILGIDTCTETIDVSLVVDGSVAASRRGAAPRQQLTRLIPFIAEILRETAICLGSLDLIAVTTGPGSFTGIRLGLATAKTLAQVNRIPLAPVNTMDAIVAGCEGDGIVIPSLDARKHEVFYAVFEKSGGKISLKSDYMKGSVEEYLRFLETLPHSRPLITGSVIGRYGDDITKRMPGPYRLASEEFWTPRGEFVATLGEEMAKAGKLTDFLHLEANYMRQSDAQPPMPLV